MYDTKLNKYNQLPLKQVLHSEIPLIDDAKANAGLFTYIQKHSEIQNDFGITM